MTLARNAGQDSRLDNGQITKADISMVINEVDQAIYTVVANATLTPPTNFVRVDKYVAANVIDPLNLLSVVNGELVVGTLPPGNWIIKGDGFLDPSHSVNGTQVGVLFGFTRGGTTSYTPRVVHARTPNNSEVSNLSGRGTIGDLASEITVQTGDKVGLYIAGTSSGDIDVHTSNVNFELIQVL